MLSKELDRRLENLRQAQRNTVAALHLLNDTANADGSYVWQRALRAEAEAARLYREELIRYNQELRGKLGM